MALYSVRLAYRVNVTAKTQQEAHEKVVKMIREQPEGFISGIELATVGKPKGVLNRLITGY